MSPPILSADILKILVKRIAGKDALRRWIKKMARQLLVPTIGNSGSKELGRSVP